MENNANDAEFYSTDTYTQAQETDLKLARDKIKKLEIELANKKREDGEVQMELLLEDTVKAAGLT